MTIYEVLIELAQNHCRFKGKHTGYADLLKFDLTNKTVSNGNTVIIKNGGLAVDKIELADGRTYVDLTDMELIHKCDDFYGELEALYEQYYASVPNRQTSFSRNNFYAKDVDNLSMKELVRSLPRIEAQYRLEAFVLLQALSADVPWKHEEHFYWQSSKNKNLIIYKEWVR